MKNIFRYILAAVSILIVAACSEQYENCSVQGTDVNLEEVSFYADFGIAPVKTTYADRSVYWEQTDQIDVFSGEQWIKTTASIASLSEDKKSAVFNGLAAEGSGTYCAVYPTATDNSFNDTKLRVSIPSEQTAVAGGFQSGANVAVSYTSTNAFTFKNVGALIGFRFKTESDATKTASVTFKARTSEDDAETAVYYGLSGSTEVELDQNGVPEAGEGDVQSVTLKAPAGGFESATTYYVVVLPGNYKGFDITYTANDGSQVSRSNDMDYELLRNGVMNIGQLNEPYDILPDEITISLDFFGFWPFNEPVVKVEDQNADGDTYTYTYKNVENGISKDFQFVICKGPDSGADYQHKTFQQTDGKNVLIFENGVNSWIQIPGIEGRYLKSVSMGTMNKDMKKRFRLQRSANDIDVYYNSPLVAATSYTEPAATTITFPTTDSTLGNLKSTQAGRSYVMFFTAGGGGTNAWTPKNMRVGNITLVYTKEAPVAESTQE